MTMHEIQFRPYREEDRAAALALNAACQPEVGPMDEAKLRLFERIGPHIEVAMSGDTLAGLIVGLEEGAPYTSPNYAWFSERFERFAYVDRVAIADGFRGRGIGSTLYDRMRDWGERLQKPVMIAEVNLEPPNPKSIAFHLKYGFERLDEFEPTGKASYRVQMLKLPLSRL